jgi:hypothetical protein
MLLADPEKAFMAWLRSLPVVQRQTLAYVYTLMTSSNSADFAMSGEEALQRFEQLVRSPEFAVRRVARLLSIRAVFSFMLLDADFMRNYLTSHPALAKDNLIALSPYQWLRGVVRWRHLLQASLSDQVLRLWLSELQQG